jgi:transposase-like protein
VPRTSVPYSPEFRAEAVRLCRTSGRGLKKISEELASPRSRSGGEPKKKTSTQEDVARRLDDREAGGTALAPPRGPHPQGGARHPEKESGLLRAGGASEPAVTFRLISAERATHHVRTNVSSARNLGLRLLRLGLAGASPRAIGDGELTRAIRRIHEASRATYGRPRVHTELRYEGLRCSGKWVARLMRQAGIHGTPAPRRWRGLTRRRKSAAGPRRDAPADGCPAWYCRLV